MDRRAASELNAGAQVTVSLDGGRIKVEGTTTGVMASDGRVPVKFDKVVKNLSGAAIPKNGKVPHGSLQRR